MAERNSKDLLQFETNHSTSSTSCLESKLFVCKESSSCQLPETPIQKPTMFPVPKSQVLGKLKDFLGVMAESNKKLMTDSKNNPDNYDIEVLSGKESEYIEMMVGIKFYVIVGVVSWPKGGTSSNIERWMEVIAEKRPTWRPSSDLMLGVADLHTPEAVAAAECAIAGNPPPIHLPESSNGSETEDSSDEEDEARTKSVKIEAKDVEKDSCKSSKKHNSKKRSRIVELP